MSQHIFYAEINDKQHEVQMGWDAPMQWFYCVVSLADGSEDAEMAEPLYSNLSEADPKSLTLDYFTGVLQQYGVSIPVGLRDAVLEDQMLNRMNFWQEWGT